MPTVAQLQELALSKLLKSMPKGKKALQDFVSSVPLPEATKKTKAKAKKVMEDHPHVEIAKEHLKKVACPVVHHKELEGKSKEDAVSHLEKKGCPELPAIKKKVRAQKKAEKSAEKSAPVPEAEKPKVKKPRQKKEKVEVPEILF